MQDTKEEMIVERIEKLKEKKNAIILAHNFSKPEIRAVADVVGGSSGLTTEANEADCDMILVCGVDFMAEIAAVLNPDKKVITPGRGAACPLAKQLSKEELLEAKKEHPDSEVLLYLNSLAKTISLADCVCTANNALKIAGTMGDNSPILFGPDLGVSYYISKGTAKDLISIPDYAVCPVHNKITVDKLTEVKTAHPQATIVAHPECCPDVQDMAEYISSTGEIVKFCKESEIKEFIVAADVELSRMLQDEAPGKTFYPVSESLVCEYMRISTLANVADALETEKSEVVVQREIADAARIPIERMLEFS
ncbi:MAG: quinolinate synthase NadA [Methanosarcinales archaeon]|nr:quinolinate synthase NadA [Methanosarcinales archaeon]